MNQNELKQNLQMALNTLNTIEVRGRQNLDRLLATIMVLEKTVSAIDTPADGIDQTQESET